jgi:hypothetical protein
MNNLHPPRTTPQEPQNLLRAFSGIGAKGIRGISLGQMEPYAYPTWVRVVYGFASLAGGALGAYHGYRRHDSIWGGLGWFLLGSFFWPIAIPVAYAQGFAESK